MTIRERLGLSFLSILLLFGLNLAIYFWSAGAKTRSLNELRQAVERRLLVATIDRQLEDRSDEVTLLDEVLRTAGTVTLEPEQIVEPKQRIERLGQMVERLEGLTPAANQQPVEAFSTSFQQLKASWNSVYDALLALREFEVQTAAGGRPNAGIASGPATTVPSPASADTAVKQLEALARNEDSRVEQATVEYAEVQEFTDRTSVAIFLLSAFGSIGLAVWVSRHLNQGLKRLTEGVRRIGSGDLTSRIGMTTDDELGTLALGFDEMSANLHAAQSKLTDANEALEQRNRELETTQRRLAAELAEAADYVRSLLPAPVVRPIRANWCFVPSTQLGGDAFGYHWLDPEHFAIYLLDVSGHGVGSALLGVSAMNVLRSQMLPQTNFREPASVLEGLNNVFQMEDHNDAYFTIWYGVYNVSSRVLTYASGGHPPALLLTDVSGGPSRAVMLDRRGLVIGGFPDVSYTSAELRVEPDSRLYVFSDGLYEVTKSTGEMLTLEEFAQILCEPGAPRDQVLDHVVQRVRRIRGADTFDDDVSLVEIAFG